MKNLHGIEPSKFMKKKDNNRAICCDPRDGPIFGSCCDICIHDNCNNNDGGWTIYGYSASSFKYSSPLKSSLFVNTAGPNEKNYFKVSDYEVFTYN